MRETDSSGRTTRPEERELEKKREEELQQERTRKRRKITRRLIVLALTLTVLCAAYVTIAFSSIPFIDKWRSIYIETAMTTNTHQWLATWFFPKSVIDRVMAEYEANKKAQENLESSWADVVIHPEPESEPDTEESEIDLFYKLYWELDTAEIRRYLSAHVEMTKCGYDNIRMKDFDENLGLLTTEGDPLVALDTAHQIIVVKVSGDGYQGKLAIVKDPSRVEMVKSKNLGSFGQEAESYAEQENAILVVNASGFRDAGGHGSGGEVKGTLIIDGVEYGNRNIKGYWKFCGMKNDNKFYVGDYPYNNIADYRWSAEFFPALVIDGESVVDGTYGMGLQPRTAVGQTKTGAMLFLIIDGRQVGYSIGCTVEDCKNILMRYGVYQAMNLDGGSSAVMWYNGRLITRPSSASGRGRYMPNALIVRRNGD